MPAWAPHPEGDGLGRVVGELHRSCQVVDQHEPFVGHRGVALTFVQLVLHAVGLLGDRVGCGDGVHRTVLAVHGDADEIHARDVVGGRDRQSLHGGLVRGTLRPRRRSGGHGLLDPANVETAARPRLPGDSDDGDTPLVGDGTL